MKEKRLGDGASLGEPNRNWKSEGLFQKMIGEIEDYAIIFLDKDGIIRNWNKGAERIKQYKESEVIGKHFSIFYLDDDRQRNYPQKLLREAEQKGRAQYEGWRIRKDGTVFWGSISLTAVHDDHGSVIGFSKVTRDLTDKKIADDELRNLTVRLQKSNEELRKSEERYHKMVAEVVDYAIILLDEDGVIQNWNSGAEKIKGYRADEIVGKNFRIFYRPEDRASGLPERLMKLAVDEGRAVHEGWRVRKDGSMFWGSIVITALHAEDGSIIGFSKVTRDLTNKKIAEDELQHLADSLQLTNEELRKSEERYHKMVAEVIDYAIILLNEDGYIQNWNSGAEKIKGYRADEIIGKNFRLFYRPEDRASGLPDRLLREAVEKGRAVHEGWRLRKDGSTFWGSVVITALHNDEGNIIGFSKVTRDLTERKRAEEKVQEYLLELEAQNRELEQFAYVASHDLQEPLRKIRTFAHIIEKNLDDAELARRYFGKITSSAERMSELIRSVLNYSRLKNRDGKKVTDLNSVMENILADFELTIQEKEASLHYDNLPVINADPLQINQLFANLIGNALKFSNKRPEIFIRSGIVAADSLEKKPSYNDAEYLIELVFEDNGIGFDQQYENLIFTIFQRLHGKHEYSGTGIGLALCKKIMENHNGYIRAEGYPDKGSRFFVYFPASLLVQPKSAPE